MKEQEGDPDPGTEKAWCGMAVKEEVTVTGRGVCIPPPASLQTPPRPSLASATTSHSGLRAKAPPRQPYFQDAMALSLSMVPQLPFSQPRNDQAPVELQDAGTEALVERSMHLVPSELRGRMLTQDEIDEQALHAALHMVADMEEMEVEEYEPSIYDPQAHGVQPGQLGFGLELMPHGLHGSAPGLNSPGLGRDSAPTPAPDASRHGGCAHSKTTKKGTNKYYTMVTCVDCGQVLERTRRDQAPTTKTPSKSAPPPLPATVGQELCPHHRITWKGTNGFQTRQTIVASSGLESQSLRRPHSATRPHQLMENHHHSVSLFRWPSQSSRCAV